MFLVGTPKSNEWFLFLIWLKEEPVTKKEAEKQKRWNKQLKEMK